MVLRESHEGLRPVLVVLSKLLGGVIALSFLVTVSKGSAAAPGVSPKEEPSLSSPWLLTPTVSADPKLGTTIGAVVGYIHAFDDESTPSMFTGFATYSDTDSYVGGVFGDVYFDANRHRLMVAYMNGKIRNEYDDFLGTGFKVKTQDNIESIFFRYLHRISGDWYLGGQVVDADYVIGSDGIFDSILEQIGLTGFSSVGVGLVVDYDSRDNPRNPDRGNHFTANNIAYREGLGGDDSFDAYQMQYSNYWSFGDGHVLASNVAGRWTHDAPLGGFSSVDMRGYTRGNYLDKHYSHLNIDARFSLHERWGASLFGGVGCLYEGLSDCGSSGSLFPMIGGGVIFELKPEVGIILRLEYAKGKSDNEAIYLNLGHPF